MTATAALARRGAWHPAPADGLPFSSGGMLAAWSSLLLPGTPFSFSFFSTLYPGSQIAAHTGPCNLRIRCHLPLIVPSMTQKDKPQEGREYEVRGEGLEPGTLSEDCADRGSKPMCLCG